MKARVFLLLNCLIIVSANKSKITLDCTNCDTPKKEKIVGGFTALEGQFPFQAHLKRRGLPGSWFPTWFNLPSLFPTWFAADFFCGASIISQRYLLTAAHCIFDEDPAFTDVVVGTNFIGDANASIYLSEFFVVHENFISLDHADWYDGINDIALIKVKKNIVFSKNVQPVKLAMSEHIVRDGDIVTIAGWGKVNQWIGGSSKHLRMIQRRVSSFRDCQKLWMDIHEVPVDDGILCTVDIFFGGKGGICKGDSGSPLIDQNGYQIGVAAISADCGLTYITPEGYTKVSYYSDWIDQHMRN